ncbi:hypothetical protein ACHAXR_011055 [Thalassiosira sp. AJA248-18]
MAAADEEDIMLADQPQSSPTQRIMELAQELDGIVNNQQNLRENVLRTRLQQANEEHEHDEEREEEDRLLLADMHQQQEHQQPQSPPTQNNPSQRHLNRTGREARHLPCSVTQFYFILSAILAFLAVVTSPSSSLLPSNMETTQIKEASATIAVDSFKAQKRNLEEGNMAMDSYGNIFDKVLNKGEWEAVVAHSKTKHSSSTDTSKKKSPPSSSSWSETLHHFIEQYSILKKLKFRVTLTHTHSPDESHQPNTAADYAKKSNSSSRWLPPWEWMKQRLPADSPGKIVDNLKPEPSDSKNKESKSNRHNNINNVSLHSILSPVLRGIDPSFMKTFLSTKEESVTTQVKDTPAEEAKLPPSHSDSAKSGAFMTIIDKVFTSTPRLIAISNLLLAVTYLTISALADFFLGPVNVSTAAGTRPNNPTGPAIPNRLGDHASRRRRAGRERFGGFLLFKLLLISAVLEPDSADLFILLSWYTLLSFLRSLSHLAGSSASHSSQSGEPPSPGALRLLIFVMACDAAAASGCVALLYSTGWNVLLLLTCDCILLGVDAVVHIGRHAGACIDEMHRMEMSQLEERQVEIYAQRREQTRDSDDAIDSAGDEGRDDETNQGFSGRRTTEETETEVHYGGDSNVALEDELREIDRAVEIGEADHSRRINTLDYVCFSLEVFGLLVMVAHLLHIWALHGASWGLIDGVLALHIHSTISNLGSKIAERRNTNRISRELNSSFPDASELDIRKSSAAGDVCCICLNSMIVGSVKKVGCGHLFHANCLREVVERERSMASAKCPLCRASLVTGRQDPEVVHPQMLGDLRNDETNNTTNGGEGRQAQPIQPVNPQLIPGEQSLLRFSTENILPSWLPVPAFAFEVVRRETAVVAEPNPNPEGGWQRFFRRGGEVQEVDTNNNDGNNQGNNEQGQPQEPQIETSFWRRLLILVGAIPMSPEEEAMALEQLVDMFPQYDRADLLRELRSRRSAEAVAESILLGLFSGIPRGGGGVDVE